ncbi:MAG: hypothetical protein IH849_15050 [Acidobacteria bacterium]|nr:hypothetical protein [Acidobacteriota bacterium]
MSEPADEQYFARVEEHFGRRRGGPLVLSPKDWQLLEKWHESGIPLRVVLRGINQTFDRFAASGPRPDRINSLGYCEQEVQAAWQDYRGAQRSGNRGGDPATPGLPAASAHLRIVSAACRSAADDVDDAAAAHLIAAADELDELERTAAGGGVGARSIDHSASALESRLHAELQELLAPETLAALGLPPFSPYGP